MSGNKRYMALFNDLFKQQKKQKETTMSMPVLKGDNPQLVDYIKFMWESNLLTVNELRQFSDLDALPGEEGNLTRSGWWNLPDKCTLEQEQELSKTQ